ncbi:hypothetical protein ACFLYA_00865, partial [Candidatus Dependentiae bacterium]
EGKKVLLSKKGIFGDKTSKKYYKIISRPSLQQGLAGSGEPEGTTGPCGYYALWNALCLKRGNNCLASDLF